MAHVTWVTLESCKQDIVIVNQFHAKVYSQLHLKKRKSPNVENITTELDLLLCPLSFTVHKVRCCIIFTYKLV